jgi:hypothetical protein
MRHTDGARHFDHKFAQNSRRFFSADVNHSIYLVLWVCSSDQSKSTFSPFSNWNSDFLVSSELMHQFLSLFDCSVFFYFLGFISIRSITSGFGLVHKQTLFLPYYISNSF